jgi:hypothetical protein
MRLLARRSWILLLGIAWCSPAQSNHWVMPAQGTPLNIPGVQIVDRLPVAKKSRWPKELPVFKNTLKPREFPASGLQTLLVETAFRGTNLAGLGEVIRLVSTDRLDHFTVHPAEGRLSVRNADRYAGNGPSDAVPRFEAVRERAEKLASLFGVSTNEMERNDDGSIRVVRSDRETSRRGGQIKFKRSRTVEFYRGLAGHTFGSLNDQKLTLELGIDGRLLKFELKWPSIESVTTNRVFTLAQVLDAVRTGKALSDPLNEFPTDIAQIEVKDFSIDYYVAAPLSFGTNLAKADIYPVAALLVTFKSKKGETNDAGLFAPIMEGRR